MGNEAFKDVTGRVLGKSNIKPSYNPTDKEESPRTLRTSEDWVGPQGREPLNPLSLCLSVDVHDKIVHGKPHSALPHFKPSFNIIEIPTRLHIPAANRIGCECTKV